MCGWLRTTFMEVDLLRVPAQRCRVQQQVERPVELEVVVGPSQRALDPKIRDGIDGYPFRSRTVAPGRTPDGSETVPLTDAEATV